MKAEFQELLKLRSEIGEDLLKRTKEHFEASRQLRSTNSDHLQTPTDDRLPEQKDPGEGIGFGKQARRSQSILVKKKAYMEAGDETTMAYDIPGGWYMAFDTTGAPLFWHNDVNEGAITWTPPMDTKARYEQ